MNHLVETLQKELRYNLKEAKYVYDIIKAYSLKESESYYSLLPDLLQIVEGDFSQKDKINDLGIVLSLYYKNEPDYQDIEITSSFIEQDITNNMTEFRERLSDSEFNDLVQKIDSIFKKL